MPDLYFTGTACAANSDINGNSGTIADSTGGVNERINDELSIEEEKSCKLHVRTLYDEHRNDLVV
ncbi:unnamed protein product, partial [Rotaria magnacalcarata]